MALISRVVMFILSVGVVLPIQADPKPTIEVFTTDEFPLINSAGIQHAFASLDEAERLTAELGKDLGSDPDIAKKKVMQQVNTPRGQELLQAIPKAYDRTARAMMLGVQRLPAVVFDGRVVIYGQTDLSAALAQYQAHKQQARVQGGQK